MKPNLLRLSVILLSLLAFLGLLVGKLAVIQIAKHPYYKEIADRQHESERSVPAMRGAILDRNCRPLAVSVPIYRVWADPVVVGDPVAAARTLGGIIPLDQKRLSRRLAERKSRYELIELAVDVETGLKIKSLCLPGICVEAAGRRVRPLGDVARNLVGSLSPYEEPMGGVERSFDKILKGEPGIRRYFRDALGNTRPCMEAVVRLPEAGNSLVLTIDADLQLIAERALADAVAYHAARGGCVVIVEPRSGDILAMASVSDNHNFPVRAVFEPGSSLKICTYAAALDLGRVDSTSVFDTNGGKLQVPGGWIRDDHPRQYPLLLREAFSISSNVAASMIARRIGEAEFYRYLLAFGFGLRTGIPLEGESGGILRAPEEWSKRSLETLAIGQEIGVTAVQLAMAYAAIANEGVLMRPRLVKAMLDDKGRVMKRYPAKTVRRVVRRETADRMVDLLESVVKEGTGTPAGIDGIRVAGKTGTGQKAANGHYMAGKYYSVFAGIVPDAVPGYVCLVVLDEPAEKGHYGGPVCGPVFREITSSFLRYTKSVFPEVCTHVTASEASLPEGVPVVVSFSLSGTEALGTGTKGRTCPAVTGLTLREAARVLASFGLAWSAAGSGVVMEQAPCAGDPVGDGEVCRLTLGQAR
jgi:cell division protein FtsI/penicillin-binding protein 2